KTTDGGTWWTKTGMVECAWPLAVDPVGTVYAGGDGMYKSTDGGTSWTQINTGLPCREQCDAIRAVTVDSAGNVYAGTRNNGVYMTTNGGTSWTQINTGLTDLFINALAVDSTGNVYAGTIGGGVFTYTNTIPKSTPTPTNKVGKAGVPG
ncbi:MAG: hypothetical protein HQK60_07760, partial [Deltaproteobacteria bacterium]|nr:hypothetical protein [Deltaproteobacteria bacterium]